MRVLEGPVRFLEVVDDIRAAINGVGFWGFLVV